MEKKAIIDLMEVIMITVLIMFLLIFIILFYSRYQMSHYQDIQTEIADKEILLNLNYLKEIPELNCPMQKDKGYACIDAFNAILVKDYKDKINAKYENLFSNKRITLRIIYPLPSIMHTQREIECTPQHVNSDLFPSNCNSITIIDNPFNTSDKTGSISSVPVSLYFPTVDIFGVGMLELKKYN